MALALAACGGGGGSNDGGDNGGGGQTPIPVGVVEVTAKDSYGAAVAGVTVKGQLGDSSATGSTDGNGKALLLFNRASGTATLVVSGPAIVEQAASVDVERDKVSQVTLTVERETAPVGGSITSRSGTSPVVDATGQRLTFEIEVVAVDGRSQPLDGLGSASFTLLVCAPDATTDAADCIRSTDGTPDQGYSATSTQPLSVQKIAGGPARPYAAALLLDQSGSIAQTDPTGARLFSAKAFLGGLGAGDRATVAAFASDVGALIPTQPLTVYGPFLDAASAATSYFPTLDALTPLVGGKTPLYDSVDALRRQMLSDPSLGGDLSKAIVVFTDGADTTCADAEACRLIREQTIAEASASGLRYFTIGLSGQVDVEALADLANRTGGAFLYADSPAQLLPLYGSVGRLLSLSLPTYRLQWTVEAASPDAFKPGHVLLGRIQVTHEGNSFDVPFVVGLK